MSDLDLKPSDIVYELPIPVHPAAEIFPWHTPEELLALCESISGPGGQRQPCVLLPEKVGGKNVLLDGRNRYLACLLLGIEPKTRIATKEEIGSPTEFVEAVNFHNRNIDTSQRAMIAADLAASYEREAQERMKAGGKKGRQTRAGQVADGSFSANGRTREQLAKRMRIGERTVDFGTAVKNYGSQKLQDAVRRGEVKIALAAELVKHCRNKTMQDRMLRNEQPVKAIRAFIGRQVTIHDPSAKEGADVTADQAPIQYVDDKGKKVPEELHDVWAAKARFAGIKAQLSDAAREIKDLNEVLELENIDDLIKKLSGVRREFAELEPVRLDAVEGWLTKSEV